MLSPKMQRMQRSVRINEGQLLGLAEKARYDCVLAGHLYKRCSDSNKWLCRWFRLYQNLLFYYDSEQSIKPTGAIFLEGCYCERLITPGNNHSNQSNGAKQGKEYEEKMYCFGIMYRRENQRQYELRANTISECKTWIDAIKLASFNKLLLQKEELEQKHLHLLQVVESEKTAKWQYTRHCEELTVEIKKLREELFTLKKEWRLLPNHNLHSNRSGSETDTEEICEDPDIAKIKKVQSFFRGWLCRRRWQQIVEEYIKSPHAESMRKRNCLVFRMVEAEEEYVEQLEILISCFLRPFKMAASSKSPPCSHEDINSIFLNSETVLFLHQIFLKGLTARMDSWPTLVLGDLFDMLLPMLSIYQEYVRNHHYSLQVLTECKQNNQFVTLLSRLEKKPACKGRSLETFLTYPMHQIPRYIVTLHELLAHTPPDHVEKKSLEHARVQLEDLSRQMHDEVSETENIRKNLAIERMIVEGCDILLDVNQVFVRQGTLIQVIPDKQKNGGIGRLGSAKGDREAIRQCFLFSNHLIVTTRTQAGRLHLVDKVGKIALADATLVEDPNDEERNDDESSLCSSNSVTSSLSDVSNASNAKMDYHSLDFKLMIDCVKTGDQLILHLVAPTKQEKAAWVTDITQCMDNVHFDCLFNNTTPNASSTSVPQFVKSDPSLFKDDVDIRFSRTLNTCKQVPQIRYATPERLLQRLTDLRFLSIDFLNTFLLTYRVFTDGVQVLEALKKVFFNQSSPTSSCGSLENLREENQGPNLTCLNPSDAEKRRVSSCSGYSTGPDGSRQGSISPRRISGASSISGYYSDERERGSFDSSVYKSQHWRYSFRRYEEEQRVDGRGDDNGRNSLRVSISSGNGGPGQWRKESVTIIESQEPMEEEVEEESTSIMDRQYIKEKPPTLEGVRRLSSSVDSPECKLLCVPVQPMTASSSAETLTDNTITAPSTPTIFSRRINAQGSQDNPTTKDSETKVQETLSFALSNTTATTIATTTASTTASTSGQGQTKALDQKTLSIDSPNSILKERGRSRSPASSRKSSEVLFERIAHNFTDPISRRSRTDSAGTYSPNTNFSYNLDEDDADHMAYLESRVSRSQPGSHHSSFSGSKAGNFTPPLPRALSNTFLKMSQRDGSKSPTSDKKRKGFLQRHLPGSADTDKDTKNISPLSSPQNCSKMGVVVTSARHAHRRSSSANAAVAFAVATAGSSNPRDLPQVQQDAFKAAARRKMSITSSAATMRVLSVLRHWVTKHSQDFDGNNQLKNLTIEFLEDIVCTPTLLPAEHKASSQLLRMLTKEEPAHKMVNLKDLLDPAQIKKPSKDNISTLSALEIAEQMTYFDHKILFAIGSEEFLGQAWMKSTKNEKAPYIGLMTERFNEMCRLIVSEIISAPCLTTRVERIEKWAAVADICRCLHNFNGVLQVCASFTNASVFRLKKTWDRIGKTSKGTIDRLQNIISSDGRHRNLRDALHRCDPPCIPYLGIYLSDLTFIDEGTPNFTENGLLNFAKMRMIAHVIREVRNFQQTPYKIDPIPKAATYLLDPSLRLTDDELYQRSLQIEPRTVNRLSVSYTTSTPLTNQLKVHMAQ